MMCGMLTATMQLLTRHAAYVLAAGIFVGLVIPALASWLRVLLPAAVAALLFLALLRIDWHELGQHLSRLFIIAALCVWFLCVCPLLVWLVVGVIGIESGLAAALVLAAACPPIVSGPAMALLLRLDAPLMLVSMVSASLIAPFTVVVVSSTLVGLDLNIAPFTLLLRLLLLMGGCLLGALLARRLLGTSRLQRLKQPLDAAAVIALLIFAIAIMDGIGHLSVQEPWHVMSFIVAAFGANLLFQLLGTAVTVPLRRRRALTVGFASGNRNMGLLLAVLPADTVPDVLLFFALAQFPVYTLPAVLNPIYRRWLA